MKNILLVCAGGMSTSMLANRMKEHARTVNANVTIDAMAIAQVKEKIRKNEADLILLGPQVRFQQQELENIAQGSIPIAVIDMKHYGQMDGKSVLERALMLLAEK